MATMAKNTICLWFDHDAEEAARFYAQTFPDSAVQAVHYAPADSPGVKAGDKVTIAWLDNKGQRGNAEALFAAG